jgi:hypothetical protein
VNFVGHLHGVTVRLAVDVEENRRLAVRIDDRIHGLDAGSDAGDVADAYWNASLGCLDHCAGNLFRRPHLRVDETQHQLVIAFDQPRRIDEVGAADRIENVGDRDAGEL